jgi:parvulin-like peptidyl-prolyl isomerase
LKIAHQRTLAGIIAATLIALAPVPPLLAQELGQADLTWQQRFLGIIPLVKPDPKDPIVVTVNGTPITAAEISDYSKTEAGLINATSTEETKAVWKDAVENLINRTLLYQEAQRRKIAFSDGEVAQRAREFQVESPGGQSVASGNAPDPQLMAGVRESMMIEKMLDNDFSAQHIQPNAQQIEQYYDQHKDLFIKDPGAVRIAHIAVKLPPNPTDAQKKAAEAKILKLYAEAQKTKDFTTLAKKSSEDTETAPKGGELGTFRPGQLPPVVDKLVFSTPVGGVSQIIESNLGYSFIKVLSRQGETYAPLSEVKAKIAIMLLDYKEEDLVKALVRNLQKSAKIEFKNAPNAPSGT